ncbi:hypothetical protein EVAR_49459_1 [Eumeta japonica]|uniref:Uncharacterized protein n=1 Tax=Eumeta variegata TaxID=151549 RepID=A0A4C1Y5Q1_EUMVA|nr:hypothetical protein EVAR_49459_1 [Eumeta japonica]
MSLRVRCGARREVARAVRRTPTSAQALLSQIAISARYRRAERRILSSSLDECGFKERKLVGDSQVTPSFSVLVLYENLWSVDASRSTSSARWDTGRIADPSGERVAERPTPAAGLSHRITRFVTTLPLTLPMPSVINLVTVSSRAPTTGYARIGARPHTTITRACTAIALVPEDVDPISLDFSGTSLPFLHTEVPEQSRAAAIGARRPRPIAAARGLASDRLMPANARN